jgi:hypothetical protein
MKRPQGRRGSALTLNLFLISLFAMMAVVLYAGVKAQVKTATFDEKQSQAQAIAEAGLEDALHELYLNDSWRAGFYKKAFADGYYTVTLTTATPPAITSTGYSKSMIIVGPAVHTIVTSSVFTPNACAYAVLSDRTLSIQGTVDSYDATVSSTVFGSSATVWSNAGVTASPCPPVHIFGDAYGSSAPSASCLTGSPISTTTALSLPTVSCPSCGSCPHLNIASGQTVTITSGTYCYGRIDLSGTLNVDTTSGTAEIYLQDNVTTHSGCQINNLSQIPSRLHMADIASGLGHTMGFNCSTPLHAYVEGRQAQFTLSQTMYGHFCASSVTISSATGAVGILHYDENGGAVTHVATVGGWSQNYTRQ